MILFIVFISVCAIYQTLSYSFLFSPPSPLSLLFSSRSLSPPFFILPSSSLSLSLIPSSIPLPLFLILSSYHSVLFSLPLPSLLFPPSPIGFHICCAKRASIRTYPRLLWVYSSRVSLWSQGRGQARPRNELHGYSVWRRSQHVCCAVRHIHKEVATHSGQQCVAAADLQQP